MPLHVGTLIHASELFPTDQRAEDLMIGALSGVLPKQLRELHIRVMKPD
jgi:aspartyl-tRNA synthetase